MDHRAGRAGRAEDDHDMSLFRSASGSPRSILTSTAPGPSASRINDFADGLAMSVAQDPPSNPLSKLLTTLSPLLRCDWTCDAATYLVTFLHPARRIFRIPRVRVPGGHRTDG